MTEVSPITDLDQVEMNHVYQMIKSPGWKIFSDKILSSWLVNIRNEIENPNSSREEDLIQKGSAKAIRMTAAYSEEIIRVYEQHLTNNERNGNETI